MGYLGNRVLRREDAAMLTVGGTYVADVVPPGTAVVVYVRSTIAHGTIESIDLDDALASEGVLAVLTAADLKTGRIPAPWGEVPPESHRPMLAVGKVRFVGEPICAVVAETLAQAVDAAELVFVDIEPLDAAVTLEQSVAGDVLLYDGTDSNELQAIGQFGSTDFDSCEVVIERTWVNQRVAPIPIETLSAYAVWEGDQLNIWASSQGGGGFRAAVSARLDIPKDQIRVIVPDVGGGFGAKGGPHCEELLMGAIARHVGRGVQWSEMRSENLTAMVHGRGLEQHITMGGTKDGNITDWRINTRQNAGAYPNAGAVLIGSGFLMLSGVYDFDRSEFSAKAFATNTTPVGAYRGAGRPEAAAALERAIDLYAAEIDMDPAELRRRNLLPRFETTHTTSTGTPYDVGDYPESLRLALDAVGYDDLRVEQARRRDAGDTVQLGLGIGSYVEITGMADPRGSGEFGTVELQADGTVIARSGSQAYGQGHATSWAMLVADELGINIDAITVVMGDTSQIPSESVTGGSRSVQLAGSAMKAASENLVAIAIDAAAESLEAAASDVVFDVDRGVFHVVGTPAVSVDWASVAAASDDVLTGDGSSFQQKGSTFPFGAHCAVVEVDTETGAVNYLRHVAVDDCGVILNPLLAEGQIHGGIAQGAAQALFEQVVYDEQGNLLTGNLADYAIPAASEFPSFERIEQVTPTFQNPIGAKGIGESGSIGSTPAVHNAVIDAIRHLGVDHIDMPCTPNKIWQALADAS